MANSIDRYEAKDAEDFARWLGYINPDKLHKLYVKKSGNKWSCMVIYHDITSKRSSVTKTILEEKDGRN